MSKLDQIRETVLAHPLHVASELTLEQAGHDGATLHFSVNDFTSNPQDALHGGILYALMDVACLFAVLPRLEMNEHAVSVEVSTSVLRAARRGERVTLRSKVDRRGRTLAAMRCEAYATDTGGSERLIATGNVTKAIVTEPAG
jgi:acyl-coenzyme A thioesterase 13